MSHDDATIYYSGQGKLYIGPVGGYDVAAVPPTGFRWVGNVPSLVIALATETLEHKESYTGQRQVDKRIVTEKSVEVTIVFEDFKAENLALGLYGISQVDAAGAVVAEDLGDAPLHVVIPLAHQGISNPVVEDSLAAPLTLGTHFEIGAEHGSIAFLDQSGFTEPYNIDYDFEDRDQTGVFTESPPEKMLRFEGLNTALADEPVLIELYKVQFNPFANLNPIQDEFAQFEVNAQALLDSDRSASDPLGQFGRVITVQPT